MFRLSRPIATVRHALVAAFVLALLWLASIGFAQVLHQTQWSWLLYRSRNNPPCRGAAPRECIPFALSNCSPPEFIVHCQPHVDGDRGGEGVCLCGFTGSMGFLEGMDARIELERKREADAGVDW